MKTLTSIALSYVINNEIRCCLYNHFSTVMCQLTAQRTREFSQYIKRRIFDFGNTESNEEIMYYSSFTIIFTSLVNTGKRRHLLALFFVQCEVMHFAISNCCLTLFPMESQCMFHPIRVIALCEIFSSMGAS